MRLFTTRARRPDRPPEVRPLDLAAIAAACGSVSARAAALDVERMATELTRVNGVRIECEPVALGDLDVACRATVRSGDRGLTIGLDRPARRAWLGLVLGLPAGQPDEGELPDEPTRLERAILERTLVRPLARIADDGCDAEAGPLEWESRPSGAGCPSGSASTRGDAWLVRCTVAGAARSFPVMITSTRPSGPERAPEPSAIDRRIGASVVPLVVRLDPRLAGVTLRAADLARLEPGDVLVTDIPADRPGGLPVEAAGVSATPPDRDSFLLRGRLGVSGGRRGVRFAAIEAIGSCDR